MPPRKHPFSWLNPLTALMLLMSAVGAWCTLHSSPNVVHSNDFKHLWAGARILALGNDPYDPAELMRFAAAQGWHSINPFVYLPTTAVMLRPLSALRFNDAVAVWFGINWLAAWALALMGPSMLRVRRPDLARFVAAVFLAGSMPFYRHLTAGQMNVVTAWLVLGAAAGLLRRRDAVAGGMLAVGFAWKIAPALLIATLAPLRRWRGFASGIVVSLTLLLLSLPFAGFEIQRNAVHVVSQMGYGQSTWSAAGQDFYRAPYNQSPNSLMHHLFTNNPYTRPWLRLSPAAANGLTVAISLLIVSAWAAALWCRRHGIAADQPRAISMFFAASIAMLLLPSLLWDHYAVQALPALIWISGDSRTARQWPSALGLLTILGLLSIPYSYNSDFNGFGAGILLMSLRLWPLLGLYCWLVFDRRIGEAAHA